MRVSSSGYRQEWVMGHKSCETELPVAQNRPATQMLPADFEGRQLRSRNFCRTSAEGLIYHVGVLILHCQQVYCHIIRRIFIITSLRIIMYLRNAFLNAPQLNVSSIFANFQRDAFRDVGVQPLSFQPGNQNDSSSSSVASDDVSIPTLLGRDDGSSSSGSTGPGALLHELQDMDFMAQDDSLAPQFSFDLSGMEDIDDAEGIEESSVRVRKERDPNRWGYTLGNWMKSSYYTNYLAPNVRQRTYEQSLDKHSDFRSHFRVPLIVVDRLRTMFVSRGWITPSRRQRDPYKFRIRCELLIMAALEHLGNRKPFRQFKVCTGLSYSVHKNFTKSFVKHISSNKDEWVNYPSTLDSLKGVMEEYERQFLPGCGGSIDVVHCKWSSCPAGDKVKAKGKEQFTTIAFEVITDNRRRILGIAPPQFGTRDTKETQVP